MPFHSPLLKNGLWCAHSNSLVSGLQSRMLPSLFWNLRVWDVYKIFQSSFGYWGVCILFGHQELNKWVVFSERKLRTWKWRYIKGNSLLVVPPVQFFQTAVDQLSRVEVQANLLQKLDCRIPCFCYASPQEIAPVYIRFSLCLFLACLCFHSCRDCTL